nr:hypothetical protein [Bacillota bacterium]
MTHCALEREVFNLTSEGAIGSPRFHARLHGAAQLFCAVERIIIMGCELLAHGRKIVGGSTSIHDGAKQTVARPFYFFGEKCTQPARDASARGRGDDAGKTHPANHPAQEM